MTDEKNLPARASSGHLVSPAGKSDGLVARGLDTIRNNQRAISLRSDVDFKKLFQDACDGADYETALRILHALEVQGSALAEELISDLSYEGVPSCLSSGDDDRDREYWEQVDVKRERLESCIRTAAEQGDALAQEIYSYLDRDDPENNAEHTMKWARKAAAQGRTASQETLGHLYYMGGHKRYVTGLRGSDEVVSKCC
jgi:TPR repeat protein